jgi:hypothetical protein
MLGTVKKAINSSQTIIFIAFAQTNRTAVSFKH